MATAVQRPLLALLPRGFVVGMVLVACIKEKIACVRARTSERACVYGGNLRATVVSYGNVVLFSCAYCNSDENILGKVTHEVRRLNTADTQTDRKNVYGLTTHHQLNTDLPFSWSRPERFFSPKFSFLLQPIVTFLFCLP